MVDSHVNSYSAFCFCRSASGLGLVIGAQTPTTDGGLKKCFKKTALVEADIFSGEVCHDIPSNCPLRHTLCLAAESF